MTRKKVGLFLSIAAMVGVMFVLSQGARAQAWSFGVMSDTQWTGVADDGKNPNSVAVDAINQINQQFISAGVKLVVAVGDVTDNGAIGALDTRAAFAQPLYNAGIGFFPLRGNHESTQADASEFQRIFPQTQNGINNSTPANVFTTANPDSATQPFPAAVGTPFAIGTNFSSPSTNLNGLSYSFDYNNTRFVLLDQFVPTDGKASDGTTYNVNNNAVASQQSWVSSTLAGKPASGQAFVFGHKGLITENHTDTLLGANPGSNPTVCNAFISSLQANGVRYYVGGHDHMQNRAIVTSPDGNSSVQDVICASDSSKFYGPQSVPNDANGRETLISQQLGTIGYSIYTVDGPRVTVNYYSAVATGETPMPPPSGGESLVPHMSNLVFVKTETYGYSNNGKEFLVAQSKPYNVVQDSIAAGTTLGESFKGTSARILDGNNGNRSKGAYDNRPMTKDINTGWAPAQNAALASDVLTLWGMQDVSDTTTDTFVLSMSFDSTGLSADDIHNGIIRLLTQNSFGGWVSAGNGAFVLGAYDPGVDSALGTFGTDGSTAWAVVNSGMQFAVGNVNTVPEPVTLSILVVGGLVVLARRRKH